MGVDGWVGVGGWANLGVCVCGRGGGWVWVGGPLGGGPHPVGVFG